jgi:hypothetical protein
MHSTPEKLIIRCTTLAVPFDSDKMKLSHKLLGAHLKQEIFFKNGQNKTNSSGVVEATHPIP